MGHEHGSEYQLKIGLHDGSENLTGWLSLEELTATLAVVKRKSKSLSVQERKVLCASCPDQEQKILEYPVAASESARYRPRRYMSAGGSRPS
jgi:hypothetical protein